MKATSIGFLFTSFFTAFLALLSIAILFIPFPDRSLSLDISPSTSTAGYYGNGYATTTQEYSLNAAVGQTPVSTVTFTDNYGALVTTTDEQITYTFTEPSIYTYTYYAYPTSILSERSLSQPTNLPEKRQIDPTSSALPIPTSTQISVPQSRTSGLLAIVILIVVAIIFIESLALGIYFAVKNKRLSKQRVIDVNEGVAAPLALPTPSVETPGGETVARDSQSEVKVIISFARCHFSCLIILVIILLIPLVLLIYAASVYNSASDYIGSVFISSIGSDRYSLGGGYEYSYYGYSTPSICSGGGYDCELSDPDVLSSFSYWAGPIIAVLVLGWILIASTICLAVLVCMHRGARRRKSRGSGDNTNGNGSRENENPLEMIQTPQTQPQSQVQGMYYGHLNQSNQSQQGGYEMGQIREGNDATVYNQAEASSMGQPR